MCRCCRWNLDQDIVIERTKGQLPRTRSLRLIQPDKFLELLAENYALPLVNQRFTAKIALTPDQFCRRLTKWAEEATAKVVLTGSSSAGQYAVMARDPVLLLLQSGKPVKAAWHRP